jgi:hypothetical protein
MGRIINDPVCGDLFFRFTAAEKVFRDFMFGENGD